VLTFDAVGGVGGTAEAAAAVSVITCCFGSGGCSCSKPTSANGSPLPEVVLLLLSPNMSKRSSSVVDFDRSI
jgi:hypothetical protein